MPKMKTKRAAAKRLMVTGSGRVKIKHAGLRHLMRGKSRRRLRALKQRGMAAKADLKNLRELIPYKF